MSARGSGGAQAQLCVPVPWEISANARLLTAARWAWSRGAGVQIQCLVDHPQDQHYLVEHEVGADRAGRLCRVRRDGKFRLEQPTQQGDGYRAFCCR